MSKIIASLVAPSGWAKLNGPAGKTWNSWPQAKGLECMGFMSRLVLGTHSATCLQLTNNPEYFEWALDGWLLCDQRAAPYGQNPSNQIEKRGMFASAWKGETQEGSKPQGLDQISHLQVAGGVDELVEAHDMEKGHCLRGLSGGPDLISLLHCWSPFFGISFLESKQRSLKCHDAPQN